MDRAGIRVAMMTTIISIQRSKRACRLAGRGVALLGLFASVCGCQRAVDDFFQGYLEGEYVYVAAPAAGALMRLAVSRGQVVTSGHPLFDLEHELESAGVREAEQRLAQTRARVANLNKGLRPTELEALQAQQDRAQANLRYSQIEFDRRQQLAQKQVIAKEEMDAVQARRDADQAQVASLKAELETARLGARADEIKAAEAEAEAAAAALAKAQWALVQKSQSAPTNGWIHDTLYREGEWVAAGHPVIALLPPTAIKVRFFVPETRLVAIQAGQSVSVAIDGLSTNIPATIHYISTQSEFTPPVIYSRESRAKLVYMIEAGIAPDSAALLKPGQPVEVRLGSGGKP
jgi:HlyD family secretion protein